MYTYISLSLYIYIYIYIHMYTHIDVFERTNWKLGFSPLETLSWPSQ